MNAADRSGTDQAEAGQLPDERGTVSGYRLVVPQEWQKIPVQRGTDRAIAALLDRAFAKHGRDQVAQYRREVESRLKNTIDQARRNAGVDLFLPLGHRERNLPASFLVSYVEFAKLDTPDPQQVLAEVLATTEGGEAVTIGGAPGMRMERTYEADTERDIPYPSRRVEYLLPVPRTADSWLVSSFSTLGQKGPDDDVADLLCTLFDAIMSTFRWTYEQEES